MGLFVNGKHYIGEVKDKGLFVVSINREALKEVIEDEFGLKKTAKEIETVFLSNGFKRKGKSLLYTGATKKSCLRNVKVTLHALVGENVNIVEKVLEVKEREPKPVREVEEPKTQAEEGKEPEAE